MKKYIGILIFFALLSANIFSQVTIKGVVLDTQNEPLIGAVIIEQGNPTNGTAAGLDGDFTLRLPSNESKIEVSYVGFETLVLPVSPEMTIILQESTQMLGEVEVVAMGFGTKSRISNIAAISQASGAVIRQSPSATLQSALAGRLPGLFQIQGSGQPGRDAGEIFIRGISTFSGAEGATQPLILIDDIESNMETLSALSPNEVESVSILKDAGSTAIFGIKGANGVILVTTRRGGDGPPRITFRADVGLQQPTYRNRSLGSYESLSLIREMYRNDNNTVAINENPQLYSDEALEHFRLGDLPYQYPNVDWYDLMFKKASLQQQYTVDVQGGTDRLNYFISLAYLDQGGLFKTVEKTIGDFNNDYYLRRYNLRSNFDFKVTNDFQIKVNANAILSEVNEPHLPTPGEAGTFTIFRRILGGKNTPWNYPAYNPDGSFGGYTGRTMNPLALLAQGGYDREFKNNVNGNITLEHNLDFITQGLKARGVMALTNTWGFHRSLTRSQFLTYQHFPETDEYRPVSVGSHPEIWTLSPMGTSLISNKPFIKINTRFDLIYSRKFGDHSVDGLVLGNWYSNREAAETPDNSVSISSRLSYDYQSRYMVELSGAYNGSDRFAEGNRFDFFPAVSVGWNLAEEPYMQDQFHKINVDMFKLRASLGRSGSDNISSYGFLETYGQEFDYFFGENPNRIYAYVLKSLANPNVRWESERKFNIGTDLRMFNNRLGITVDYFDNRRQDILAKPNSLVLYAGYLNSVLPQMNLGITENKGWDGEISWNDKIGREFNYNLKGTFGYAKNKIVEMDEAPSEFLLSMQTGRPIGAIFGYIADGFYNTQEEIDNGPYDALRNVRLGDLKYRDVSGPNGVPDGIIDNYDRVEIGNSRPNFNFGFTLGFQYRNVDFSSLFQGATGAYLSSEQMLRIGSTLGRPIPMHQGRWTHYDEEGEYVNDPALLAEMNRNASFPVLSQDNGNNQATSTFWMRSANYLRWKNLEVGYNLPRKWYNKWGVTQVRIYGNAQNLVTFHNLHDFQVDPESSRTSASGTSYVGAIDTYPQQRIYNFGCQITL